jgi:hypothetical protein
MPADATIVLPPNSGGPTLDGVANIAVTNSGATVLVAAVYSFSRSLHTLATPSSVLLPQLLRPPIGTLCTEVTRDRQTWPAPFGALPQEKLEPQIRFARSAQVDARCSSLT